MWRGRYPASWVPRSRRPAKKQRPQAGSRNGGRLSILRAWNDLLRAGGVRQRAHEPCAASDSVSSGDQQRRMGRRLSGGLLGQNSGYPTTRATAEATCGASTGSAAIGMLHVGGVAPFMAANTSSRHGPHSAVPVEPSVTRASVVGNATQVQHTSRRPTPLAETQIEPLASGGKTASS